MLKSVPTGEIPLPTQRHIIGLLLLIEIASDSSLFSDSVSFLCYFISSDCTTAGETLCFSGGSRSKASEVTQASQQIRHY